MGGGTSRPQPEIRTYVGGQLSEVIESTDGSRRSALRSQKSNYSVPSFKEPAQPEPRSKNTTLQINPDSPSHVSDAVSSPNESPGGTWTDPTAGHITPTRVDTSTSPGGVPGGVKTLQPLQTNTLEPLTKLDSRQASVVDGTVEAELAALRAELVSQRKATESLTTETRELKSQFSKQLANLTHLVMTMSATTDAIHSGKTQAWKASRDEEEAVGASPECDGASSDGPSPVVNGRVRSKSGKDRRRRMSLNAMTTAGV